jgi:DNA-directed RNA polymerase specialized sigma24 family protein
MDNTILDKDRYILSCVRRRMKVFLVEQDMIHATPCTIIRKKKKGQNPYHCVVDIDSMEPIVQDHSFEITDTIEVIVKACETEQDAEFVIQRLLGAKDCEIATRFGCSVTAISRLKNRLYRKYSALCA